MEKKAIKLGASSFGNSKAKNKRYYVIYNGKTINFGQPGAITFSDKEDEKKRDSFRARHSKIKLKDGTLAYKNKNQAAYWSWHLLW